MELMRHRAWKIIWNFGSVALKNDKFFAGLGIEEASTNHCRIDKKSQSYQLTMYFLDGINQYLDGKTPIEFSLLV
jgi:penicillin amidase